MKGKIGKFLAGITTVVALGVGTMSALPAHAGTNGQQLYFENYNPLYSFVCISGYNQYDQVTTQCINLSHTGYTYDYNWWWKGYVNLQYYNQQGQFDGSDTVGVPANWGTDWYYIQVAVS